ncbi:thiol:disulfide interchange protein [Buchnera aphidicola (Aphis glycines)]|uniref:Thiol:disulfide interchange protein n=1 Tax=Buchnera aphidicola (Aphis glycines) TaxID=1265350 RepID=A0A0M4H3Q9_9GAMM|nr:DsbA family protein [Buchnera aphidicola]ALD15363.1 thiol:disulfide interchange protein [Buchnera aphidicola (Aphis glycines)]
MKKKLFFLYIIFFSYATCALEFNPIQAYKIKKKNISNVPEIMQFFSFLCPYCYNLEKTYNIRQLIRKKIHQNIRIKTYHVNFLGGELGKILTKVWIIAEQMGVEEKIITPIFQGIQESHTLNNINDIKAIFLKKTGVNINKYNQFWNSFFIKVLIQQNNNEIKKTNLNYVPAMLINGKYTIQYSKLEMLFKNHFSNNYIKLIKFLLLKKNQK